MLHPCFGAWTSRLHTIFFEPKTIALYPNTSSPTPISTARFPFRCDLTAASVSVPSTAVLPSFSTQQSCPKRRSLLDSDGMPHVSAGLSLMPPNGFDPPLVWFEQTIQ